jgi:hypothetical protein
LQVTNYKLQIANYKLQITNCKLQITKQISNCKLQITKQIANFKLQIANYKLHLLQSIKNIYTKTFPIRTEKQSHKQHKFYPLYVVLFYHPMPVSVHCTDLYFLTCYRPRCTVWSRINLNVLNFHYIVGESHIPKNKHVSCSIIRHWKQKKIPHGYFINSLVIKNPSALGNS